MRVFLDTSVLVASILENHPAHTRAFAAVERMKLGQDEGTIGQHSLAEVFAVLTGLPRPLRLSPAEEQRCIEENFVAHAVIVGLGPEDYRAVLKDAAQAGCQSGMVYDALLVACARKVAPDRFLTLNRRHFQAIAPDLAQIEEP